MADNLEKPAIAPVSDGSPNPETTPAAPAAGAIDAGEIIKRLDALAKTQENQRSLHDRQMTAIQQAINAARTRPTGEVDEDGGEGDAGDAAPKQGLTAGQIADMLARATTDFKVNHPDWTKYWPEIEAIGADPMKARNFLRYKADPDTGELVQDFYASLVDIRGSIEMQRLRKQVEDANPANKDATGNTDQAKADASAIGGAPASIPQEVLGKDYKNLTYNEKVKKLVELGLIDVDPKDLPEALR